MSHIFVSSVWLPFFFFFSERHCFRLCQRNVSLHRARPAVSRVRGQGMISALLSEDTHAGRTLNSVAVSHDLRTSVKQCVCVCVRQRKIRNDKQSKGFRINFGNINSSLVFPSSFSLFKKDDYLFFLPAGSSCCVTGRLRDENELRVQRAPRVLRRMKHDPHLR